MSDTRVTITCPHCQRPVSLDEALTHQLESKLKLDFESKLQQLELKQQKEKVEMWKIAQEKAAEKVKAQSEIETKLLKDELEEKNKLLEQARQVEVEIRKAKNKLEDEKKSFEVEKMRQLDAERDKIKQDVVKILSEEHQLRDAEKDKKMTDMLKTIEEMKRKAQQGSQQSQGEILELELEQLLQHEFPFDEIISVAKGVNGADVLQKVCDPRGKVCGTIAWESKRTKAWSEGWISKLKDDQRAAKADVAVLVSTILPNGIRSFGYHDGIYICAFEVIIPLALLLRATLIQITETKQAHVGKNEKMEILYNYLSGPEFRGRVETIIEAFTAMRTQLEQEKRVYVKLWAQREKQIERVVTSTVGMHGDLKGLMGVALPEIKDLTLESEDNLLFEK